MNPLVSSHIASLKKWKAEISLLREIVLATGLVEVYKWKQPCYSFEGKNILIVSSLKDYCFVSFLKGVLLKDPNDLLEFPGDNSQSAKLLKYRTVGEIEEKKQIINTYVQEAIKNEKQGKKVNLKTVEEFVMPLELVAVFSQDGNFKNAFVALTKGRQKGYLLHFAGAKQSKTRMSRILNLKGYVLILTAFSLKSQKSWYDSGANMPVSTQVLITDLLS